MENDENNLISVNLEDQKWNFVREVTETWFLNTVDFFRSHVDKKFLSYTKWHFSTSYWNLSEIKLFVQVFWHWYLVIFVKIRVKMCNLTRLQMTLFNLSFRELKLQIIQ